MKAPHLLIGAWAEEQAIFYLQTQGIKILHTNWRNKRAEIDIIIETKKGAAFVEVKYRNTTYFGKPNLAITKKKETMMQEAAEAFMQQFSMYEEIRFDIITIEGNARDAKLNYFKDAFFPNNC